MRHVWVMLLAAFAFGAGAQTVIARGKDSSVVVKEGAAGWVTLDGSLAGTPDACRAPNGDLFVVVRGTDDGGWLKRQQNGEWSPWISLGGRLKSDISIICMPDGTARAFARDKDDTLSIHTTNPRDGWEALGGRLDGPPDVSMNSKNVIDVVVRGADQMVWHARFTGKEWLPWRSLGVRTTSDPTIVRVTDDRADVFITQGEGVPYQGTVPDSGAMTVASLGGSVHGGLDASSVGDGRIDVVGRGPNDSALINSYDGERWSGWKNLGGNVSSDPTVASVPQRKRAAKA